MTTLLLIDVQNDFHPGGSLAIPTANEDATRIATLIRQLNPDRIVATLDSHPALHIAHPHFWIHGTTRNHPDPFTVISAAQVMDGTWKPRDDLRIPATAVDPHVFGRGGGSGGNDDDDDDDDDVFVTDPNGDGTKRLDLNKYCIEYCRRLEEAGRFQLCIWPPHCLIGTEGHAIVPQVHDALLEWSRSTGRSVEFVMKGQELLTEMYSAVCADVPISKATSLNEKWVMSLLDPTTTHRLIVAGQAMSHCVNYTVRDIVKVAVAAAATPTTKQNSRWTDTEAASQVQALTHQIYLVTDCASAVPGFEGEAQQFQDDMRAAGVNLITSWELLLQQQQQPQQQPQQQR